MTVLKKDNPYEYPPLPESPASPKTPDTTASSSVPYTLDIYSSRETNGTKMSDNSGSSKQTFQQLWDSKLLAALEKELDLPTDFNISAEKGPGGSWVIHVATYAEQSADKKDDMSCLLNRTVPGYLRDKVSLQFDVGSKATFS